MAAANLPNVVGKRVLSLRSRSDIIDYSIGYGRSTSLLVSSNDPRCIEVGELWKRYFYGWTSLLADQAATQ